MAIEKPALLIITATLMGLLPSLSTARYGTATYYNPPYVPSACYGYKDNGVMIAAASDAFWWNGAACGSRYYVTCIGPTNNGIPRPCRGSVVVKIVDYCPPGSCYGTIDLSQQAFAAIADPRAGKINIKFTRV